LWYEATKKLLAGNSVYEFARRRRETRRALEKAALDQKSYQEKNAISVDVLRPIRGAKVLVVGANEGEDCRLFVERGASEVHGLDVIESTGKSFQHRSVRYHRASIEASGLAGDYFDIVFSVATMEHVHDIKAGFCEMARLASPGGLIFSLASPLWQSPYGHHMACFNGHPWAHLVHDTPEALTTYAKANDIQGERGIPIHSLAEYILHPEFFNRRPADEFVEACSELRAVDLIENRLVAEPELLLSHPLGKRALELGYTKDNLLSVSHLLVARKI
jgi:SAM-dependent methyltransferase